MAHIACIAERRGKLPDAAVQADIAASIFAANGPVAVRWQETGRPKSKAKTIVFLAHQALIAEVLRDPETFGLAHYDRALKDQKFFLTDDHPLYDQRRALIHASIGREAQSASIRDLDMESIAAAVTRSVIDCLLDLSSTPGRFDLIRDYAFLVPYLVAERAFGVTGRTKPGMVVGLLQTLKFLSTGRRLNLTGQTQAMQYMLINSMLMLGQVFANFETRNKGLNWLSRQASDALVAQIHAALGDGNSQHERNLIGDLYNGQRVLGMDDQTFRTQATGILFEVIGTMILLVGHGFSQTLVAMRQEGLSFAQLAQIMVARQSSIRFIDEALRLNPVTPSLLRTVKHDTVFHGVPLNAGEYVCCLIGESRNDTAAFPQPEILNWNAGAPPRDPDLYVGFGPAFGPHACFGQHWAREIIRQMCLQLARFPDLRIAQGRQGRLKTFQGMPESLRAFYRHAPRQE